ncbi:helix-turn-helix domain containing protein [Microbacterium sp. STN6]|uniref:TetR/AcrR family transcriptional regulator n=1 Tax=Microbacterium sp. STN6 TaxID=2995588 RepID=UPI002260BFAA|nr:helix-turn-helix domain-containing protein [Microbacterium sp. STN6]MCX7521221.1 helix-turn-helix domain containing protein [Microbacterium sp. STN6]
MKETSAERIPAAERREQILAAASQVFGERGYVGATTDLVAKQAGISQPYVVRMFGSKENLFLEVLSRALDTLTRAFRAAIAASHAAGEDTEARGSRIGLAYADLISDRGILLSLMQGFLLGHDPVIGERAREGFLEIYDIMRNEAGLEADHVVTFLSHGMLFNTLVALRMPEAYGVDAMATELVDCTFRTKLDTVLHIFENENAKGSAARG